MQIRRSRSVSLLLLGLLVSTLCALPVFAQSAVERDRAALVALYNATDGPNWVLRTNWLSDEPLGDWYGINTDIDGRELHHVVVARSSL